MSSINFEIWTKATGDLPWGVQHAMYDALTLVKEGKIEMVHGADVSAGKPCLVNAICNLLSTTEISPSQEFPEIVGEFDIINRHFDESGVNTHPRKVSPLAAEILLKHFSELKTEPAPLEDIVPLSTSTYIEPSDSEFADMLAAADNVPPPVEFETPLTETFDEAMARVDNDAL